MERRVSTHLFLLCGLNLLNAGGFLVVVTAEPTVTLTIITPEADRKEGGQVQIRCVAANLEPNHFVEWRRANKGTSLYWNGRRPFSGTTRFLFSNQAAGGETTTILTIINLQKDDTDEYRCNVREPDHTGGNPIVANDSVALSVKYFPNESFPMCYPGGPLTVDIGTELDLQCSSEAGNSAVIMEVFQLPKQPDSIPWRSTSMGDTLLRSLDLRVHIADNDSTFSCLITSAVFPGMSRSCIIGPIRLGRQTPPTTTHQPPSPPIPWIAAFAVAASLLAAAVTATVILVRRDVRQKSYIRNLTARKRQSEQDLGEITTGPVKEMIPVRLHAYSNTLKNENNYGGFQGGSASGVLPYERVEVAGSSQVPIEEG